MSGLLGRIRRLLLPSFDLIHERRRAFLRFVPPGATVLDAGCGDGEMALLLARRGHRVVGVSNDAAAIERAQRRAAEMRLSVEFRVHDLARGGPPGQGFDAALCFDVLEHVLDDRSALAAVAGALREGGRLLLTVPDRAAPPLVGDAVSATEDGGHVRPGYSRAELEALLAGADVRPLRWRGFAGYLTQKAMNVARRLERREGRFWLVVRFAWLVVMRGVSRLDPLIPGPRYGLFVEGEKTMGNP